MAGSNLTPVIVHSPPPLYALLSVCDLWYLSNHAARIFPGEGEAETRSASTVMHYIIPCCFHLMGQWGKPWTWINSFILEGPMLFRGCRSLMMCSVEGERCSSLKSLAPATHRPALGVVTTVTKRNIHFRARALLPPPRRTFKSNAWMVSRAWRALQTYLNYDTWPFSKHLATSLSRDYASLAGFTVERDCVLPFLFHATSCLCLSSLFQSGSWYITTQNSIKGQAHSVFMHWRDKFIWTRTIWSGNWPVLADHHPYTTIGFIVWFLFLISWSLFRHCTLWRH